MGTVKTAIAAVEGMVAFVGRLLLLLWAVLPPMCVLSHGVNKPVISVSASAVTATGEERAFWGPKGKIVWAPSLPLYKGDRMTVAYSTSGGSQPSRVLVRLDDRSFAVLKKAPWKTVVDTSKLKLGRHVLRGEVRFPPAAQIYGISDFVFFVQNAPARVMGVTEGPEPQPATGSSYKAETATIPSFMQPPAGSVDENFKVNLSSLDPQAGKCIRLGQPIYVRKPVTFYHPAQKRLDRWSYTITRDGRQVAGSGPMSRLLYLEVARQSPSEPGLLPGNATLRVWGVTSAGVYSRPIELALIIE